MAGRTAYDLDATEIVDAAIELLREQGIDAVSMRNVGARLGVSPVPLYSRIGNKDALLDAIADRLLDGMAPERHEGESWQDYAIRWTYAVRARLIETTELRLLVGHRRAPFVKASGPLVDALRGAGFEPDAAVQAVRLLLWAVAGFATIEARRGDAPPKRRGRKRPGGDPTGVTPEEAEHLFGLHIRYLIEGIDRDR